MLTTTTTTDIPNLPDETYEKVVMCDPDELKCVSFHESKHSDGEIDQFQQTILDYTGAQPIVIDDDGTVVAGHGRVEAAKLLGIEEIPALPLSSLTGDDVDLYIRTLAEFGKYVGWTRRMVKIDLRIMLVISAFMHAGREKKLPRVDRKVVIRRQA